MALKDRSPIFFIIIMFIFLIFTYEASSQVIDEIVVFHLKINQIYALILLCLIFVAINSVKFYFDRVAILLAISAILGLLPLMYADYTQNYLGNYLPLLISFAVYFICLQVRSNISEVFYKIILICSLVISLQVIYTEWIYFSALSFSNFNNVSIKGSMDIPIGSSNLIASILLPMMVFLFIYKKSWVSFSILTVCLYALLLCRSKNALLLLIIFLLVFPLLKLTKYIIKDRSENFVLKFSSLSLLFCVFGFLFYQALQLSTFIVNDLSFNYYSSIGNSFLNRIDVLLSGRLSIYNNEWDRFTQHFFLGNGFGYELGQSKSHNWILDLLVQKGVVGLFLYIATIGIILKEAFQYRKDIFIFSILCSLTIILIQGLFEISVFTIRVDFLFWTMAGLLMAKIRYMKSKAASLQ